MGAARNFDREDETLHALHESVFEGIRGNVSQFYEGSLRLSMAGGEEGKPSKHRGGDLN
jgi:hypothetical protein